ncbi:plasmid recombination protein [Pseudomonas sp. A2]|uniref:plasmid recombination protein n=1 Tax=Pseudomonas sp. A2 TaxID=107445 RepID=UPI003A7F0F89
MGQRIVRAELHLDERTPHIVAYITPLTQDSRLSARDFLGGPTKLDANRLPPLVW